MKSSSLDLHHKAASHAHHPASMHEKTKVICIIGPSASGKDTQSKLLSASMAIPYYKIDLILSELSQEDSPLGQKLLKLIRSGTAISLSYVYPLLAEIITEHKNGSVILDGYPRTLDQADLLYDLEKEIGRLIVVEIEINDKELIARAKKRLSEPNHVPTIDDDISIVRDKLMVYRASKNMIHRCIMKQWAKSNKTAYLQVDGNQPIETIHQKIFDFVSRDME